MPTTASYTVEDVLKNEFFREMHLDPLTTGSWTTDTVMHTMPHLLIEYASHTKRVLHLP